MATLHPRTPPPPNVDLLRNVFYENPGPDLFMDMAGHVKFTENLYLFCIPSQHNPNCQHKIGYRSCLVQGNQEGCQKTKDGAVLGHQKHFLPQNASVVWQHPSPFDVPYDSRIEGADLHLQINGRPLLFRASLCEALAP